MLVTRRRFHATNDRVSPLPHSNGVTQCPPPRRLVVVWTQVIIGGGVAAALCFSPMLPYSTLQYVVTAVVVFVSCNVLEGECRRGGEIAAVHAAEMIAAVSLLAMLRQSENIDVASDRHIDQKSKLLRTLCNFSV